LCFEYAIETFARRLGRVSLNDQIGCSPLGAEIAIRIREPAR
jgi:hypothetical protein